MQVCWQFRYLVPLMIDLAERLENYRNEMKKAALESSDQLV